MKKKLDKKPKSGARAGKSQPSARSPWSQIVPEVLPGGRVRVVVEMRVPRGGTANFAMQGANAFTVGGFELDKQYAPVPMSPHADHAAALEAANEEVVIVRGTIPQNMIQELERQPNVLRVWRDTPIAPFACPIAPCDCTPSIAKGTIADVAQYLGVDQIWGAGFRGTGIVIGIVDGGVNAIGRPQRPGETAHIARVIGGWPVADWGTTAAAWGDHGDMTSTDTLGMAPEAQIYDIRISDAGGAVSNALQGFQWAIDRHRIDGTPQILSNSWGIFQKSWDPAYATDPNHFFTRKVIEALNEGILVLFAAGNCGDTCPDGRCGPDTGPGKDIWGANGHPQVMTVGAVNRNEEFVGYSSEGPAALDPQKPDFCSITHFTGFFPSDSGTSAATPVAAGVVALLKQADPTLTQDQAKNALRNTAKDIGPAGWDPYSGAGIIRAKAAFDSLPGIRLGGGSMGMARLNVWVSATDDPCGFDNRTWFVNIYDCHGKILKWCGKTFGVLKAPCGHLDIPVPPGCYRINAVWSFRVAGTIYSGNHFTDNAIVCACCDEHVCVKLFNPSIHRCGIIFTHAIKDMLEQKLIPPALGERTQTAIRELLAAVEAKSKHLPAFDVDNIDQIEKLVREQPADETMDPLP